MKFFAGFFLLFVCCILIASAEEKTAEDICRQPARVGRCRASIPAWHYDPETAECKKFKYGGCDGNDNRYDTKEKCEAACKGIAAS